MANITEPRPRRQYHQPAETPDEKIPPYVPKYPKYPRGTTFATPKEIRALLSEILDEETAARMVYNLRKKIAKGNVTTLEFVFAYLLGRPAVVVQHQADDALVRFMSAWQELMNRPQEDPNYIEPDGIRLLPSDTEDAEEVDNS